MSAFYFLENMQEIKQTFDVIYAIIVAAGKGLRMGCEVPKQLLPFGGKSVLETAVSKFASQMNIDGVYIVSPDDGSLDAIYEEVAARVSEKYGTEISVVRGGLERGDSVQCGLAAATADAAECGFDPDRVMVMIHDAVRPGIESETIEECIGAMTACRTVSAAVPATDSIRMISRTLLNEETVYPIITSAGVDRRLVYHMQTPQCFRLSDINMAYELADKDGFTGTDDASIAEYAGFDISLVRGSRANTKITTKEDIRMATRTGTGYDVHRLVPGRPLILCGTPIPAELGLDGHSDADVAVHALMDALLGAAGLGDIGRHFPDTDDKYKGADSMKLLAEVRGMLGDAVINNVDITIIAQAPKLAPYMETMKQNLSEVLGIPGSAVNVKATTEEGLGFTGRGEGIAAIAAAAIEGSF